MDGMQIHVGIIFDVYTETDGFIQSYIICGGILVCNYKHTE